MRSFLTLALTFASMCSYLSWATQQPLQQPLVLSEFSKIARINADTAIPVQVQIAKQELPALATVALREKTPAPINPESPLNLSVPGLEAPEFVVNEFSTEEKTAFWFEKNQNQKIRYDAELLFDEKEGSSIRGGQLNITIPLG